MIVGCISLPFQLQYKLFHLHVDNNKYTYKFNDDMNLFLQKQPPGEARGGRGGENDGDQAAERRRLALAVLPALEQLPNEPHQRVRSAAAVGELRRRDARLRREFRQGSQDGTVGLQPVLPDALLRQPVSASDRHHEGHQVAGAQCRGRVHVQGRDQRVAGTNRAAAKGRRDPEDPGLGRRRQRAQARQTGRGPAERDLGEGGARAATRPQQHRSAAAKKAPTHELAGAIAEYYTIITGCIGLINSSGNGSCRHLQVINWSSWSRLDSVKGTRWFNRSNFHRLRKVELRWPACSKPIVSPERLKPGWMASSGRGGSAGTGWTASSGRGGSAGAGKRRTFNLQFSCKII
ncbi:unnamed protein product [Trichogramma brassicae]|uniref:Uncharacterized protein n=1 Tax=Trichogramma brassicae TaxID=86971 RepID=A0A6H5IYG6_9HYME|nr:unnamed protein product [Trichogramma brassicae]